MTFTKAQSRGAWKKSLQVSTGWALSCVPPFWDDGAIGEKGPTSFPVFWVSQLEVHPEERGLDLRVPVSLALSQQLDMPQLIESFRSLPHGGESVSMLYR